MRDSISIKNKYSTAVLPVVLLIVDYIAILAANSVLAYHFGNL